MNTQNKQPLLEVKDFSLAFRSYEKGLRETRLQVIKKLNMTIHEGEIVAVVGASGSGKSLLANAVLGILPGHAMMNGTLNYKGKRLTSERLEMLRGSAISLIPQSVNALDPLMKTGKQVSQMIQGKNKKEKQQAIFKRLGLSEEAANQYPFELSGGMARRVLATTAMVSEADLIIADEPTPGIDPIALNDTLNLMKQLAQKGKGMMFISHDIGTALKIADKVVVFYDGETIEEADVSAFTGKGEMLKHPYTKALWNALPQNTFNYLQPNDNSMVDKKRGLEVTGISFKYEEASYLFKDLQLCIRPGEIVGIHGYSGAGKTSLAQIIAGYIRAETGNVKLEGKPVAKEKAHPIQLIWQHPEKAINPRWRVKKVLSESGMEKSPLLAELGIKQEWIKRWPSELSGGQLQRVCIARALNDNTKFIIADEMTTMLDAVTQAKLWEVILRIARERGIGVLAISHDRQLLSRISNRIIDFNDLRNI